MSEFSMAELEREDAGYLPGRELMQCPAPAPAPGFTFNVIGSPGAFASVTTVAQTGGQEINVLFDIRERGGGAINI